MPELLVQDKRKRGNHQTDPIPDRNGKIDAIENLMIEGITNQTQISKIIGISQPSVCRLMKELQGDLIERDRRPTKAKRIILVSQLGKIQLLALKAWEDSCNDEIEVTRQERECSLCFGIGKLTDLRSGTEGKCKVCDGSGTTESVKTKVKNRTGDSSYLKIVVDCIREAGKMQGTYIDKSGQKATIAKLMKSSKTVGGEIQEITEAIYAEVPVDLLLKAKLTIEELKTEVTVDKSTKSTE